MTASENARKQHSDPISNEYAKIWIENSVLLAEYIIVELDLERAKEMIELRYTLSDGASYPCLVDIRNLKSTTKAARDLMASEKGYRYMSACALIVDSSVNKYIGNFFMRISKPKAPTKLFTKREEALKWLQQF